jgi:hypothetical protein
LLDADSDSRNTLGIGRGRTLVLVGNDPRLAGLALRRSLGGAKGKDRSSVAGAAAFTALTVLFQAVITIMAIYYD